MTPAEHGKSFRIKGIGLSSLQIWEEIESSDNGNLRIRENFLRIRNRKFTSFLYLCNN